MRKEERNAICRAKDCNNLMQYEVTYSPDPEFTDQMLAIMVCEFHKDQLLNRDGPVGLVSIPYIITYIRAVECQKCGARWTPKTWLQDNLWENNTKFGILPVQCIRCKSSVWTTSLRYPKRRTAKKKVEKVS